ncbi:glycerophosphodiester phosphodiesterase family protein [Salinisphaera sp. Q1T1-3]|uniref:glycerophosphodiester phosphodiesterase family protein n=1 Tax=Salinisphaera sp. Q1T1-3 TaxID=2321229 RepID=UPI0013147D46|nr:glycerophosphodiester phosphodiesterase family protein [Salinisphaera sp. Q1T1-3]
MRHDDEDKAARAIPEQAVIAHRGASRDAPEATRAAYLLARDLGADYLEADLQRTRDGHLIVLHDTTLERTTDIETVFPERVADPVSTFSLAEIKQLDAGSWFNKAHPSRARPGYAGLQILTLDELREIAESGTHQPGLYLETKAPELFPGIEAELADYLRRHGWIGDDARRAPTDFDREAHVAVGYSAGRVVLQTFARDSLAQLAERMPDTPKILLLGLGGKQGIAADESIVQRADEPDAVFRARCTVASSEAYDAFLDYAVARGAIGVGASTVRTDLDSVYSYADLARPWMIAHVHRRGLHLHVYTLDHATDFQRYIERGVDGVFTNDPLALCQFVDRSPAETIETILARHGH